MDAGHQKAPVGARRWVGCGPELQSGRQQAGSYEERSKAAQGSSRVQPQLRVSKARQPGYKLSAHCCPV
ncbi:hypothetical protein PS273GM_12470 [Stutzerimonas stutzeri]|uniref:Uncharacterized protein n=1 Tax=Stutzerimonas stutzeri TaxID=316 RepID=A0A172WQX3_STUST|nr:hypothetical protein PS273GM_12470 [Stutzerimonas stutzeri]